MEEIKHAFPDFRDANWLKSHTLDNLKFYYPKCIDEQWGGFIQGFSDDGTIVDQHTKHLVSTTRFIYTFSVGALLGEENWCLPAVKHGVNHLQTKHLDNKNGGYYWQLSDGTVTDGTKHAYGHAFALLALAMAYKAGVYEAKEPIYHVYELLEQRFWDSKNQLYLDECSEDWSQVSTYRGQNANMHMCEAMIAAYEATKDKKFLIRAYQLATSVVLKLGNQCDGLIWEHYNENWSVDWIYNIDDPKNIFRPYGFLPGHFVEWSKLLLILERYHPDAAWILPKAKELFDLAMDKAWDTENGGLFYTLSPKGEIVDTDKYYWVMSEAIAAAALLANRTGDSHYWTCYEKLWKYSWEAFIDHKNGGWYRLLTASNQKYSDYKSPPTKTDYHPIGACYEILRMMNEKAGING